MCVCVNCGLTGESCCCQDISRCCSCEFYDHIDGCTLEAPTDCLKEE